MGVPLVAHYHGGAPARRAWLRAAQRDALDHLDGACFTDVSRAAAWGLGAADAGRGPRVFDVLETSTELTPVPRDDARARVRARWGVTGDPLYACVARLDPVKDPLTVIRGFARLLAAGAPGPDPRLVMAYTDAPMEAACRAEVERLGIATRVAFVGRMVGPDVAVLLSAADAFVQASVREVCGVAVLEAAAVGAIPIVTDLPVFRRNLGPHGARFPIGDDRALAEALGRVDGRDERGRAALRAHFAATLSFAAMAAEVEGVYRALVA
jgi:glycosyltransferase involved in cell wall biosynthesis